MSYLDSGLWFLNIFLMDLNLIDAPFDLRHIKPGELEEILEDPFAIRFLPDNDR